MSRKPWSGVGKPHGDLILGALKHTDLRRQGKRSQELLENQTRHSYMPVNSYMPYL